MTPENSKPQIDLWYGRHQRFGQRGHPQRWINILGRVSGPEPIQSLHYALNGGSPIDLSIGSDQRRLIAKGDFNIDLDLRDLNFGHDSVEIVAVDRSGQSITEQVTLDFANADCPLPYTIDWHSVSNIQDVAQVVDGNWTINNGSISPAEIGYDRLLAIGDMRWQDYEVTVPITLHGINGGCYEYPSVHAGVGIVMRWKGHSNWGRDQWASGQPYFGPGPYGTICWYCIFHHTGPELNFFDPDFQRPVRLARVLPLHVPHIFKARVQTLANGSSEYRMKVWPQNHSEPVAWDLAAAGTATSLSDGSVLLGAHHVAASFGNISIVPI
jgi:hypothetical protein